MSYRLGADLPAGCPGEVAPGTSLLVTGPPMVGKRRLALELLAAGQRQGEGAVLVTTDVSNVRVAETYERLAGRRAADGPPLRIVDAAADRGGREVNGRHAVEFLASPGDLTGAGIALNKAFGAFGDEGVTDVRLALDSLSTLLTYLDAEEVYKFLHVLSGRVANTGSLGVYTLNTAAADPQAVGMLKNTVDGVVRLEEEAGENRAEGFDGVTG